MGDKAIYEPGTLDQTRKNIGAIDAEEAKRMTKILGGEIFTEKSAPIDMSKMPKQPIKRHAAAAGPAPRASAKSSRPGAESAQPQAQAAPMKQARTSSLPNIPARTQQYIDRLMMSPEYHIKANYGVFNFIKSFQKNGKERVAPDFASTILSRHIDHINAFITIIKTIVQTAPASYKQHIQNDDDLKFRLLRKVSDWSVRELKVLYIDIAKNPANTTIEDMIPFTREIYGLLIQLLYLGETKVSQLLKEIYTDEAEYPDADKKKISGYAREAVREWAYLYNEIIKGLYPLLMRMCGTPYEMFPGFFTSNAKKILTFLNKNKFDLLLIEKESDTAQTAAAGKTEEIPEEEKQEPEQKEEKKEKLPSIDMDLVKTGIQLLNTLFPQAGFNRLDRFPDMYPYFQPLFDFDDGFNLLAPENPLQVTLILMRIVEDLFHGCRNINFDLPPDIEGHNKGDTIQAILNDWSAYSEMLFNKRYANVLVDYVNELYSKSDFAYSAFGKKTLNKLLWSTKYYFLPMFKFDKLTLERPEHDTTYTPIFFRTQYLCTSLMGVAKNIDKAGKTKALIAGVKNPWDHYHFDIPNPVSERLDVLLGAKRVENNVTATNANLIKYTLCILSVLNWWMNDADSPAYQTNPMTIYRISPADNMPVFSVPLREDQRKLFAENIKAMAKKKQAAAEKK